MEERGIIEDKLRKKLHEVEALEDRLKTARVYVQALQDILRLLDKDADGGGATLKAGSAVAKAREIILERREPVHITAILEAMGKDASRETRASLTSSLAAYVRRGEIFTRPAPNTFGLDELGHATEEEIEEPPPGFGRPVSSVSVSSASKVTSPPTSNRVAPHPAPKTLQKTPPPIAPPLPTHDEIDDDIPF